MKKLNKKGFTLVELLAVIVILAVIMVITIPTVLGSMSGAKKGALDSAAKAIEDYVEKQYELCTFGNPTLTTNTYERIFDDTCILVEDEVKANLVSDAGYKNKILNIFVVPAKDSTDKYTGQFTVVVEGTTKGEFGKITSEGYTTKSVDADAVGGTVSTNDSDYQS